MFNKVILMGNMTRDPELKYTQNGVALCKFGLAMNRKFKDQSGADREETCFVDVTAWKKTAELVSNYLSKGSQCLIEGELITEEWQDKTTGKNRSKLSVRAVNVRFVGSKQDQAVPTFQQPAPVQPIAEDDVPF